jgi:hypothetical protein
MWIGISADESAKRCKPSQEVWVTIRYPLRELGLTREDCARWLWSRYQIVVPKSACIACPFHDDVYWRELQLHSPDEFKDVVSSMTSSATSRACEASASCTAAASRCARSISARREWSVARSREVKRCSLTAARVSAHCEYPFAAPLNTAPKATVGIAGVNTRPLQSATLGVAGNWGSTLRPYVRRIVNGAPNIGSSRLGDRAAQACWGHASYLLDYTYVMCPDRSRRRLRFRPGFAQFCAPESRLLPLYLDSAAYREASGTAPSWSSYTRFCQAIELIRPDGAMARDVVGDQIASLDGYERLCSDGYGDVVIPVWQVRPAWDETATAATNGRLACRDATLRAYVERSAIVAIGGLVHGPCPRSNRHQFLAEFVRSFPDTHFWALGQLVGDVNGRSPHDFDFTSITHRRFAW